MLVNNIILNGIKSIIPSTIQRMELKEWFGRAVTYISANRTEFAVISAIVAAILIVSAFVYKSYNHLISELKKNDSELEKLREIEVKFKNKVADLDQEKADLQLELDKLKKENLNLQHVNQDNADLIGSLEGEVTKLEDELAEQKTELEKHALELKKRAEFVQEVEDAFDEFNDVYNKGFSYAQNITDPALKFSVEDQLIHLKEQIDLLEKLKKNVVTRKSMSLINIYLFNLIKNKIEERVTGMMGFIKNEKKKFEITDDQKILLDSIKTRKNTNGAFKYFDEILQKETQVSQELKKFIKEIDRLLSSKFFESNNPLSNDYKNKLQIVRDKYDLTCRLSNKYLNQFADIFYDDSLNDADKIRLFDELSTSVEFQEYVKALETAYSEYKNIESEIKDILTVIKTFDHKDITDNELHFYSRDMLQFMSYPLVRVQGLVNSTSALLSVVSKGVDSDAIANAAKLNTFFKDLMTSLNKNAAAPVNNTVPFPVNGNFEEILKAEEKISSLLSETVKLTKGLLKLNVFQKTLVGKLNFFAANDPITTNLNKILIAYQAAYQLSLKQIIELKKIDRMDSAVKIDELRKQYDSKEFKDYIKALVECRNVSARDVNMKTTLMQILKQTANATDKTYVNSNINAILEGISAPFQRIAQDKALMDSLTEALTP